MNNVTKRNSRYGTRAGRNTNQELEAMPEAAWEPKTVSSDASAVGSGAPMGAGICEPDRRAPWRVVIAVLAALVALWAGIFFITGQNAVKNTADYIGDATGVTAPNASVRAEIEEHTTFQSVPNVLWKEGERDVGLLIANPEGNPVDMAPHVFIDVNGDGSFTEDECVWNPQDSSGEGDLLAPGSKVDQIHLDRLLKPGVYDGQVVFTAYHVGSHAPANGMTMAFKAKVV